MNDPHIQAGNIEFDAQSTRGWLVVSFIDEKFDLRHTKDVEIKWGALKAGEARENG